MLGHSILVSILIWFSFGLIKPTERSFNINTNITDQDGGANYHWKPSTSARTIDQPAVSTLVLGEGGKKAAIRLLLAYVNRGKMECKVVLGTLGLDSLDAAFTYLIERLTPPNIRICSRREIQTNDMATWGICHRLLR